MQKPQLVFAGAGLFGAVVLGCAVAAMWPDPEVRTVPAGFGPGWLVGVILGAFLAVLVVVGVVAVQRRDFEHMSAAELRDYRDRRILSLSLTIAVVGACGAGIFLGLLVWSRCRPEPAGWSNLSMALLVGAAGGSACLAVFATIDACRLIARRRRRSLRDRDVHRTRSTAPTSDAPARSTRTPFLP